jgi:hypothetical protein
VPAVLISPWLEKQVLSDELDHTSLLRYATDKWALGPLGERTAAAKSFASSWKVAGAVRTDVPANIPEPTTLPNPVVAGLNPNQLALVGFSRYLETKTMAMAEKQGPAAASAMTMEIGQRVLWSSAKDRHGEVAVQRVDRFFEMARQAAPGPRGGMQAKKQAQAAKGAAKKASKAAAKKVKTAEKKTTPVKKTMNPLRNAAAKEMAKRTGKAVAKKALGKAIKKSAQKRAR